MRSRAERPAPLNLFRLVALTLGVVTIAGALSSCAKVDDSSPAAKVDAQPGSVVEPTLASAARIVAELRARPGTALEPALAAGFDAVANGLAPQFSAGNERSRARTIFPSTASGQVTLEDTETGVAVAFGLREARPVSAQVIEGYLVYAGAHESGATVLQRAFPSGTEDYLSFERRPAASHVEYDLTLEHGVEGLRLVEGTLELLDGMGSPRLRMEPPYLVGADGATTGATVAVEGCTVDTSAAAPWGRPVTPPGASRCRIRVSWNDARVSYPAVLDPRWTTTNNTMTSRRQGHTATLLANGLVLVAGGTSNGTTPLATAELFNPFAGTWATTGSMATARTLHTATQLKSSSNGNTSGKILVAGGFNGSTSLTATELYTVSTGLWAQASVPLNAARHAHVATLLADGRVLVTGGLNGTTTLNSGAVFNAASGAGSWTATGPLPSALKSHQALLLSTSNSQLSNKVLVFGGNNGSSSVPFVYLYNPTANAFSTLANMPQALEAQGATALPNGRLVAIGGKSGSTVSKAAFTFDPSSGTGTWTATGLLTTARFGHSVSLLPSGILANGTVLVAGGSDGTSTLGSAELWDGAHTFTATTALPSPAQGHIATVFPTGKVLIAGGVNGSTTLNTAAVYDPSSALGCSSNSQCASGFCANGVCCDTACTGACSACNLTGSVGTCSPIAGGTVCRAAADVCDVAETCNGSSLTCPADGFKPSSTVCRAVAGACDAAESCTGTSASCPADASLADGTACNDGNPCVTGKQCEAGACSNGQTTTCKGSGATGSGSIGASGGDVALEAVTVSFPSLEFTSSTNITITSTTDAPPPGVAAYTPIYRFDPDGTQFSEPATVTFVVGTGLTHPTILWSRPGGGWDDLGGTYANGTLSATVTHFSEGFVAVDQCQGMADGTACTDGNACTTGETCQAGVCTGGSAVSCVAAGPCHSGGGACDPASGCPATTNVADGTQCDDGDACTQYDTCHAGACIGGSPMNCTTTADQCHSAATCDHTTGLCSATNVPDGQNCDDGNRCTVGDSCHAGVCVPGGSNTCTAPTDKKYLRVVDLGSLELTSFAKSINNKGEVVGSETSDGGIYEFPAEGGRAFRWSETEGKSYIPTIGGFTWADDINDSGVIAGSLGQTWSGANQSFLYDPATDTVPRYLYTASTTTHINSSGYLTGAGYFPYVQAFRWNGDTPFVATDGYEAQGQGIDEDGTIVGYEYLQFTPQIVTRPIRYSDSRGFEYLNDLLPAGTGWVIGDARFIGHGMIVGGGGDNGLPRAYRATLGPSGEIQSIIDLGILPQYAPDAPNAVTANRVNASGEIVGAIYAGDNFWPQDAYVYSDATGIVDLSSLTDPQAGWHFLSANGINDNHEVVGYGYHNGATRAFKLTLPDLLSPCPAPADVCHTQGKRDLLTGLCTTPASADGIACNDGDACTQVDTCQAGACVGGSPMNCATTGDQCRSAASCDHATGLCSATNVPDGQSCDDGNRCTVGDSCNSGVCVPGSSNTCTASTDAKYLRVVDLGTLAYASYAKAINNHGEVVGVETSDGSIYEGPGAGARAFRWSETEGKIYLPSIGGYTFANNIDDNGVIGGSLGQGWMTPYIAFHYDPAKDPLPVYLPESSTSEAINSSNIITGGAYFPDGLRPFRWTGTSAPEELPALPRPRTDSVGFGIDDDGTVVGIQYVSSGPSTEREALRYSDGRGMESLNDLLPPGSGWSLLGASSYLLGAAHYIHHGVILAGGAHNGLSRACRITVTPTGDIQSVTDLGILPQYATDAPNTVGASSMNASGEIAGSVYDTVGFWPQRAFVYTDATGPVDLTSLLDPQAGWSLVAAFGINDNHEVVGYGYHNGVATAYKLTLPDLSPCPAPADACHVQGTRDLLTGVCSTPVAPDGASCGNANACSSGGTCQAGSCTGATVVACPTPNAQCLVATCDPVAGCGSGPALDGTTCDDGNPATQGETCQAGVCSSSNTVVPSLIGVAVEGSVSKAIFMYTTAVAAGVNIPYGPNNGLFDATNTLIPSPPEEPPTFFTSGPHGPFVITIPGTQITWTVQGRSVTASAQPSSPLTVTTQPDGSHDAVLPGGGGQINLDSTPPVSPTAAKAPPVGAAFNGMLTGSFAVNPSGAATYTVPITTGPGVAGMAPNFALTYSSQGGEGIAGLGWSLTGVSAITRCPRTRQQDGYGRPVLLDSLDPSKNPDRQSDGLCLDGEKLFEQSQPGQYVPEKQDFSSITRDTSSDDGEFTVVTKGGETRHYGRVNGSLVLGGIGVPGVAVWLLDRVVDGWGNYFDIEYNNSQGNGLPDDLNSFQASGIWVSKINYTGSLTAPGCDVAVPPASCFFSSMTFQYKSRDDTSGERWHWTTFGSLQLPLAQLLTSITTPLGTYALTYQNGDQLKQIDYTTTGGTQVQPLVFGWQPPNTIPHPNSSGYTIPSFVGTGHGLTGTQFVDLNGDGRLDFVLARANGKDAPNQIVSVLNDPNNDGSGWGPPLTGGTQTFPLYLSDKNDKPTGVRFADMDGDGRLDVLVDSANVSCDSAECTSCPIGVDCGGTPYKPAVWMNRFTVDGQGGWDFDPTFDGASASFTGTNPTMLADLDGDGKTDLVGVTQFQSGGGHTPITTTTIFTVTLNVHGPGVAHSWGTPQTLAYGTIPYYGTQVAPFQVEDVNRDGLADLVHDDFFSYPDGSVASTETVLLNTGVGLDGKVRFQLTTPHTAPAGGSPIDVTQHPPHFGDINGDGFMDLVDYEASATAPGFFAAVGFGDGTGSGFSDSGGNLENYFNVLKAFSPSFGGDPLVTGGEISDYGYALADIDGDGLVDLVRNHWQRPPNTLPDQVGGGEILLNTGRRWQALSGNTQWQLSVGTNGIPFEVPSEASTGAGSAFVDLDGDGLQDLVQEEQGGSWLAPGVWMNQNQRPIIQTFPNGLAKATNVHYVSTTSAAGAKTYKDDDGVTDANTKLFAVPLNVVDTVTSEDASGGGGLNTATYKYHSLRQDAYGRGPLGFHRVEIFDQASQLQTVTTYLQAYPYTGMVSEVDKYQVVDSQPHLTNKTTTTYCDTVANPAPTGLGCGPVSAGAIPAGTTTFVHPSEIIDAAYLYPENDDDHDRIETTTDFTFDEFGNSTFTSTSITKIDGDGPIETFAKTSTNTYVTPEEQREGKPDSTVVTGTGGTQPTLHTTSFEYSTASAFGGTSSQLALVKKHVEPGAGWPLQLDTAYGYDPFGNVETTTSCATDFDQCSAGAVNPACDPSTPGGCPDPTNHSPFRTTTVSYDPSLLGASVPYGKGRFPTKTTNAAGHVERTVYDPVLGKVLKKTGPNGISTCYSYDDLGRTTSQTDRCGTDTPIVTTTQYFVTLPRPEPCLIPPCAPQQTGFSPPNSTLVTVTNAPNGETTWSYSDDQGKSTGTLAYAFDGGFIESTTAYNALGQVAQVSKPFHLSSVDDQVTPFYTTTTYDSFNRVQTVTDSLGVIDGSGSPKSTVVVTSYLSTEIETDRVVNGQTETRIEAKNAIGKVSTVYTLTESGLATTYYRYDADGDLTITGDPDGNETQTSYDTRGHKISTSDPDMGTWSYTQDGFGDLVSQTDAKNQTVTFTYDALGRPLTKTDGSGTAQWVYDVAPGGGIGKVAAFISAPDPNLAGPCTTIPFVTLTDGNRAGKSFQYTAFGDVQEVDECADGAPFATTYQYDPLGRQSQIRYPAVNGTQLAVGYHYTSLGYFQYLTDDSTDYSVLWQAKAMNALGQVIDEQMRNGVETVSNRNVSTGWLLGSTATSHADNDKRIQDWTYGFDEIGNLLTRNRNDEVNPATSQETFTYDLTNRLTGSALTTSDGYSHSEAYAYDVLGNIQQKADNAYTYGTGCMAGGRAAGPHAVCTVGGGGEFVYDANGNLTNSDGRSVRYNPSNKVTHIDSTPAVSQGNDTGSVDFMYGADGNRVVQSVTSGGITSRTVYVGLGGTGNSLYERTTTGTTVQHVNFIYAGAVHGGAAFALRVVDQNGSVVNKYNSFDHLGSVTAMSDDLGHVAGPQSSGPDATVLGYDAWGARRNPDGTNAPSASFNLPVGHRQFTGQEQIPDVGLVNMNGRLYDPVLGRFLSPDPNVQIITDLQSFNRYAYARNNPLRYTDPTGFFWSEIGNFFKNNFSNPITDIELGLSLGVCIASSGTECYTLGVVIAAMNVGIAAASGAGFEQTLITSAIGLGVGFLTGGFLGDAGDEAAAAAASRPAWQTLIMGTASSAVTTVISNIATGQAPLGYNVLGSAFLSAAQGAVSLGIHAVIAASQASATAGATQNAAGTGESRLEAMNRTADNGTFAKEDPTTGVGDPPKPEGFVLAHDTEKSEVSEWGEQIEEGGKAADKLEVAADLLKVAAKVEDVAKPTLENIESVGELAGHLGMVAGLGAGVIQLCQGQEVEGSFSIMGILAGAAMGSEIPGAGTLVGATVAATPVIVNTANQVGAAAVVKLNPVSAWFNAQIRALYLNQ